MSFFKAVFLALALLASVLAGTTPVRVFWIKKLGSVGRGVAGSFLSLDSMDDGFGRSEAVGGGGTVLPRGHF